MSKYRFSPSIRTEQDKFSTVVLIKFNERAVLRVVRLWKYNNENYTIITLYFIIFQMVSHSKIKGIRGTLRNDINPFELPERTFIKCFRLGKAQVREVMKCDHLYQRELEKVH